MLSAAEQKSKETGRSSQPGAWQLESVGVRRSPKYNVQHHDFHTGYVAPSASHCVPVTTPINASEALKPAHRHRMP